MMNTNYDVGIVGGGVSGSVIALQLANNGISSILFEQNESLVNGPPFCHLHAGGNLYPDISIEQCKKLMRQSLEMFKLFPQAIDERPSFISVPKSEKYDIDELKERLDILVEYYKELIEEDPTNKLLGEPENYYKLFNETDIESLLSKSTVVQPRTPDEWMSNAIKYIDYTKLKMPVLIVQEYGWNLFRLGAHSQLAMDKSDLSTLKLEHKVIEIEDVSSTELGHNWIIKTKNSSFKTKYLINACGFKTGEIDEALDINVDRLVEFKAAYISKWHPLDGLIPEMIFHGERGTPHGMAQLTPYQGNYYQIHGMTKDITLFNNGLVESKGEHSQPELDKSFEQKIYFGWNEEEVIKRTKNAINYVSKFVPSFKSASVVKPPLYGAQQIPGEDPSLRVGEVSFPKKFYARSEIVKASSALTVANQIIEKLQQEKVVTKIDKVKISNAILESIEIKDIDELAKEFTQKRGYPPAMSKLLIKK